MGNLIGLPYMEYSNKKPVSKILELEGWGIIHKNNEYIYYNKFNKIEIGDYPYSVSDYNDIYNFYKTELLSPTETVYLLNNLHDHSIILEEDNDRIQHMIKKIKMDNDLCEYNDLVRLCFS